MDDNLQAADISVATNRVRLATQEDEEELMELCRELYDENGLTDIMSETRVRAMLHRAFAKEGAIVGVIGQPGAIEASIALAIGQLWYSTTLMLEELFSFVRREHRRSTNARDLLVFAKTCSNECKLPLIIGVLSNTRTEAKMRLYERQFGKPAGGFFVHGRKTGHKTDRSSALQMAGGR